jgi:hypothetical protein
MCRPLLVAHEDVSQLWVIGEHVVERQDHAARVAPDHVAPLAQQRFAQRVCTDARSRAVAGIDACVAQHLLARALRLRRGSGPRTRNVPNLRHRTPFP